MSPRSATTREDLLRATLTLLEAGSFGDLTLGRVASKVGVSRQAVYLHFSSKTDLLLALVEWIDERGRLPRLIERASSIKHPVERLLALVRAGATYMADIGDVGLALRAARLTDGAARAAWNDRGRARLQAMRGAVQSVADAGLLAEGLSVRAATDIVYTLMGFTVFEDLVRERGWSQRRYEDFVVRAVRATLVAG